MAELIAATPPHAQVVRPRRGNQMVIRPRAETPTMLQENTIDQEIQIWSTENVDRSLSIGPRLLRLAQTTLLDASRERVSQNNHHEFAEYDERRIAIDEAD